MSAPPDRPNGALRATVYRDAAGIEGLRNEWRQLSERSPDLTPWQQWEFAASWWPIVGMRDTQGMHRVLRIIVIRDARRAVLLLPLQISRRGRFGMRWLEPLGMPDDIHRPRLAVGALDRDAYLCALREIGSWHHEWDGIRIDEKTSDDPELQLLSSLIHPLHWRERRAPLHPCPILAIDRGWKEYLASRSHKLRKNLGSGVRKLQAHGEIRLLSYRSPDEIRAAVETLVQITAHSWKSAAGIGLGSSERYRSYFRDFANRLAQAGLARAYCLFVGATPVAATIAFIRGRTYYSTQIAHDAKFDACSPGTLLESMEMQALHEQRDFDVFDFLGAAISNKRRWTDTLIETQRILWLGRSLRARSFDTLYFLIKPRLAACRSRFRASSPGSAPITR